MDVACSTLCFSRETLEAALRHIAIMEFPKVDLAVGFAGAHLSRDQVVNDPAAILHAIRQAPTIGFAALTTRLVGTDLDAQAAQLDAVAHLAKQLAAPVVVIDSVAASVPDAEIERLTRLERVASLHGTVLTVTTKTGTLTENPDVAVRLCEAVAGLGLTLDPTHYLCGPHQGKPFDQVFPFVRHVHLRDSGRRMDQYQVKVGRGEVEYGKVVTSLKRFDYRGALAVAVEDALIEEGEAESEVRKLQLLLESLI